MTNSNENSLDSPDFSSEKPVSEKRTSDLPGPEQRPESDVVIFDGDCQFCTAQVQRLQRWDRQGRLAYLSLHDPEVPRRYPDLSHEELMERMYVVDQGGGRHGGAAAFRYLTRRLPALWPFAPLMHLPFSLPLWQWGYRQIAKRRYRWNQKSGCNDGRCDVHLR